jgi:hypothetical protein
MSFIRTTTFTLTKEEAEELRPGKLVYNALIPGRKYVAQALDGLIQTAVWKSVSPDINSKWTFTIFTECSTLEDLQAYTNQPTIRTLEEQIAKGGDPLSIQVYEHIG